MRTHAYLTEDARPKPLKKVPKAKGTPPGLISEDPIAVRGQKENLVPVEFLAGEGGRVEGELNQSVEKGKQCTAVKAVPEEGWAFDYWTIEPVGTAGDAKEELVFTVPGDADANGVVIQAHFKPVATPAPSASPSPTPSASPSATPQPTGDPTPQPTGLPTAGPTAEPTLQPTEAPTEAPHTHTWGPEETLSPASCTAPGRAKHTCACGASEEYESGAALGHDFSQNGPTCSRCTEPNPNYSAGSQPTAPPAESNGEQGGGAGGGA